MQLIETPRLRDWYRQMADSIRGKPRESLRRPRWDVLTPKDCPVTYLEGFTDLPVLQPGLDFYLGLLRRGVGFSFVKRTHGFWDGLGFLCQSAPEIAARVERGEPIHADMVRQAVSDPVVLETLVRRCQVGVSGGANFVNHFHEHFYTELVEDLQAPLALSTYFEANSFEGFPHGHNALNPVDWLRRVYHSFHTSGRPAHDALVWKQSIIDGTFREVVEAIRDLPVMLVGPPHLSDIGVHLGLRDLRHIVIPLVGAPLERSSLLKQCSETLRRLTRGRGPATILYQAGALSFWLIYRLFPRAPRTFHLDVGRCLDVWYPDVGGRQPWFLDNREEIIANMNLNSIYK
jgi:hypothetical protein